MVLKLRESKETQPLRISGYSHQAKVVKAQIDNQIRQGLSVHTIKKSTEELLTMTREVERQLDDLINRASSLKSVYHTYNKSSHSALDIDTLYRNI